MRFIFCPVCSEENDANLSYCRACGRNLYPSKPSDQIIDVHPSSIREVIDDRQEANEKSLLTINDEFVGVKGFLVFLCVLLIVFIPVMWIGSLRQVLLTDFGDAAHLATFKNFINYTKYTHIFFSAVSIFTGIALMCKFRGAIGIAKLYWLMQPILIALYSFGLFNALNAIDPASTKGLVGESIFNIFGAIFWGCVWYVYLSKSKRVHATYELTGIIESLQAYGAGVFSIILYTTAIAILVFVIA